MNLDHCLQFGNRHQEIASTNFFQSSMAARGRFFLSWNAGAGRLLVPAALEPDLREMRTAKYVIVSSGQLRKQAGLRAYELIFEDHSDAPYVVTIGVAQSDRWLSADDTGDEFPFTVWTANGKAISLTARHRRVRSLPCLKPWR